MTGGQWRGVPGGVDVHARGQVFSATADNSHGDPWGEGTIFTDEEILDKFYTMVGLEMASPAQAPALKAAADGVAAAVETLETTGGTVTLTKALTHLAEQME
jgi:hypothetical protein